MKVPPELWPELSTLLDEALDLAPDARDAWLDALDVRRPDCAAHVRGLLGALGRADDTPLGGPSGALLASALGAGVSELEPGQRIGDYRLLRPIGRGGMASVWLADQVAAVRRTVALKIPHRGLTVSVVDRSRFQRERDLLAALEHPNIARLYDAGVDAGGLPYLAMEWIDGQPLTRWCDARRLGLRERLVLFRQVLRAVQCAHAKLIIHRDLKPSNILVTQDGQVKLLDFGIAQMLHEEGADEQRAALTPDAASPEQLAGQALGTPSDVYSLGVVLYELLTGARPYRLTTSGRVLADELARTSITPPAAVVPTPSAAEQRASSPRALTRSLRGPLDAIVRKAMHPRPEERYAGAADLDADLERYLGHWPVLARPAGVATRLRCFARRNRAGVVAATLVALALCAGTAVAWWQASRANAEARRAQAVQAFLVRLFSASEPERAQGKQRTARELLDRGARELATGFASEPELRATLHEQVGTIYVALGDNVAARPHAEAALRIHEARGAVAGAQAIQTRFLLLELLVEEGLYDEADATAERILVLGQQLEGVHHRWALPAQRLRAWALMERGDARGAAALLERALKRSSEGGRDPGHEVLRARNGLANARLALGELTQARDDFIAIVAEAPHTPGYERTDELTARYNLGRARFNLGEWAACVGLCAELVPSMDQHLGPQHDRTIKARALWAQALAEVGRLDEAIREQRANLAHARARGRLGEGVELLQSLTLAKLLRAAARYDEGVSVATPAVAAADALYKRATWMSERGRWILGDLLVGAGKLEAGREVLRTAVERARQLPEHATHPWWADLIQSLGLAEHSAGRTAEASAGLERALKIYGDKLGAAHAGTLRCAAHLAWVRASDGAPTTRARFDAAAEAYARATGQRPLVRAELAWMAQALATRPPGPHPREATAHAERALRSVLGLRASTRFIGLH